MMLDPKAELLESLIHEVRSYSGRLEAGVKAAGPGQGEAFDDLYRIFHSIRGAAASTGVDPLRRVAGEAEGICEALALAPKRCDEALLVSLKSGVKAIAGAMDALEEGAGTLPSTLEEAAEDLSEARRRLESSSDDDELIDLLREEARGYLDEISHHLRALAAGGERRTQLVEMQRPIHTLKGAASTVGFETASGLAHLLEDLLEQQIEGEGPLDAEALALMFDTMDGLEDLMAAPPGSRIPHSLRPLFDQLKEATVAELFSESADPATRVSEAGDEDSQKASDVPDAEPSRGEKMLRVPVDRLDEVVRVTGELLVHRSGFEKHFSQLQILSEEMRTALGRLSRLSDRLETEYEARALMSPRSGRGSAFSAASESSSEWSTEEFDSLELDRYTDLHLIVRELAETSGDLDIIGQGVGGICGSFEGFQGRLGRMISEIQDDLLRLRMVPVGSLQSRLFRTVRATATECGKSVDWQLEGGATEIDKNLLEELAEPLLHILRNAVDHGIELPEERRAQGKSDRGLVRLRAGYEGTQVVLTIEDDGRGLDLEALQRVAIERGHLEPSQTDGLSPAKAAELAFLPRLSTAEQVSEVSGRGVGLDVARSTLSRLRGNLTVKTEEGRGTTLRLRVPMTLAVTQALFLEAGGETLAVPMRAIAQILSITPDQVDSSGDEPRLRLGDAQIPLVDLGATLGLAPPPSPLDGGSVLVVETGEGQVAARVESFGRSKEIVVKSLGSLLHGLPGFLGATLTGEGEVVLIVDPTRLDQAPQAVEESPKPWVPAASEALDILVVDDSLSVRRVLSNLARKQGWQCRTARDGVDALERLQEGDRLPDVVLLDLEMPKMDGYELTATMRAEPAFSAVPIVILTSRAGDKHRRKAFELGVTEYLVKPYDEGTLVRAVNRVAEQDAA